MENKAHYTLIGAFIIFLLASLFFFLIWLAKFDIAQKYNHYDIYFEESVFGLDMASPVTYNGIPVGQVRDIAISPKDPSKVLVTIRVKEETPVLVDSEATLGMQGITGVLFVQIMGGSPGSPPLEAKKGEERPVIPSRPSTLEEFFGGSGELIQSALETLNRVNRMLSDENIASVTGTLANVEDLTAEIAAEGETIAQTLKELNSMISKADDLMGDDMRDIAAGLKTLTDNANAFMARVDTLVADSSAGVTEFSRQGLPELRLLLVDLRTLARSLNELAMKLEERPSEIIFKTQDPEYEVDK